MLTYVVSVCSVMMYREGDSKSSSDRLVSYELSGARTSATPDDPGQSLRWVSARRHYWEAALTAVLPDQVQHWEQGHALSGA